MTGWHVGQPNTGTCPRQNDTWTNAELTRGPMANLFTHKWLDRWTNQAMTRVIKKGSDTCHLLVAHVDPLEGDTCTNGTLAALVSR